MHWLIWLAGGVMAGWIVGLIMRGSGYGLVRDLLLGIFGGVAGGWLLGAAGLTETPGNWWRHLLVSVIGGSFVVGISRLVRRAL